MSAPPRHAILVVDEDVRRGEGLARELALDGYRVELARNIEHARVLACSGAPELALIGSLDAPRGALTLLEQIRRTRAGEPPWSSELPVLVLGSGEQIDVLRAFEAGADDFLGDTANYLELRARVRALLRRRERTDSAGRVFVYGLEIDAYERTALLAGHKLELRRLEFELLVHMAREPSRVFAREELLRAVWGYRSGGATRTVDNHASRLRRKLQVDRSRRWMIGVWGVGYRLT